MSVDLDVDTAEAPVRTMVVGRRVRKLEAESSVSGRTRYVDDLRLPNMLFTRTRMAEISAGRIVRLDTTKARALPGVHAVLTHADVPHNGYGFGHDEQRVFSDGDIRFRGQLIAAVAADTESIAQRAVDLIEVEYDLGAGPHFDAIASVEGSTHEVRAAGNTLAVGARDHREIRLGDARSVLDAAESDTAATTVRGRFQTQMREHASMEPHCSIGTVDPEGRVTVYSCNQVPHFNRQQLAHVLGLPISQVRLVVANIGGGFGAKIDMLDDPVTALLAMKTGRPVKWRWTREQEFVLSSIDHAYARIDMESAVEPDGSLTARSVSAICDIGRELIFGGMGIDKFGIYARGPYDIPDYAYDGYAAFTNKNGAGACRGFHVLDATWAFESHMDDCAAAIGADPLAFRLKNAIAEGDLSPTGWPVQDVTVRECALAAAEAIGWIPDETNIFDDRRPVRAASAAHRRRGVGICVGHSGAGLAGGGDPAAASVEINMDGGIDVRMGSPEDGAGEKTVMGMIAAEALDLEPEQVGVIGADTDATPWTGGTFGNRVTFIDGGAVLRAAQAAREQALEVAAGLLETPVCDLVWQHGGIVEAPGGSQVTLSEIALAATFGHGRPIVGHGSFATGAVPIEADRGQGHATGAYIFAACAVDLEVDLDTGEIDLLNVVLCHDVGKAVNPLFVEGQYDGGIAWAIGAAMTEDLMPRYPSIEHQTRGFDTYRLPTVMDMPPHQNIVLEIPSAVGPFGAKALGEYTANLTHAAIRNAVHHATGIALTRTPMIAERVLEALHNSDGGTSR